MTPTNSAAEAVRPRSLSAWDAASVVFGIVVGTSLFRSPPIIFGSATTAWIGMLLWLCGGILSLCGALCYCELVTTFPQLGAEFVFLNRCYGRFVGFLFAWTQIGAATTGSIGAMAFVLADYGAQLWPGLAQYPALVATGVILVLGLVNFCGLKAGKITQNLLTVCKLLGLGAILVAGLVAEPVPVDANSLTQAASSPTFSGLGLAMVFVLFSYSGWNDSAQVATEVHNLEQNIPRVMVLTMSGITVLYLVVNGAYLHGLSYQGVCSSSAPAAELMQRVWGDSARQLVSVIVIISALGAVNGTIFSGIRLAAAMGSSHPSLASLGVWNARGVPVFSLFAVIILSVLQVLAVGTRAGHQMVDSILKNLGARPFPWDRFEGGFDALVSISAPTFWGFFFLSGLSLPLLRVLYPDQPRPFRVPFYPVTPVLFTVMSLYMLYSSITYAGQLSLFGPILMLAGALVYVIESRLHPVKK